MSKVEECIIQLCKEMEATIVNKKFKKIIIKSSMTMCSSCCLSTTIISQRRMESVVGRV